MTILLVIHGFITLALIGVILIQRSEGGGGLGMGGSNSSGSMFTTRGAANFLTRLTTIFTCLFFGNCLLMAYLSQHQVKKTTSIIDIAPQPIEAPGSSPGEPTLLPEPIQN